MTTPPPTRQRRTRSNTAGDRTAGQFLDAAERLFTRYGYEGTRVRAIADASGVALGALHYYWGSKQVLFEAVFDRRLGPLVQEREQRLDTCAAAEGGKPNITEVVRAVVTPAMVASADGEAGEIFAGVMARALTDPAPEVRDTVINTLGTTTMRYMKLLRECCPHLDDESFRWRFLATLGAAQNAYAGRVRFGEMTGASASELETSIGIDELVTFIAAGLTAPTVRDHTPSEALRSAERSGQS